MYGKNANLHNKRSYKYKQKQKKRVNDRFLSFYLPLHSGIKGNSYFTWSIFGIKTVNKHPSKAGRKKGRFAKKIRKQQRALAFSLANSLCKCQNCLIIIVSGISPTVLIIIATFSCTCGWHYSFLRADNLWILPSNVRFSVLEVSKHCICFL